MKSSAAFAPAHARRVRSFAEETLWVSFGGTRSIRSWLSTKRSTILLQAAFGGRQPAMSSPIPGSARIPASASSTAESMNSLCSDDPGGIMTRRSHSRARAAASICPILRNCR